MTLERAKGGAIDITALEQPLETALDAIFAGRMEADRFNILITEAGLARAKRISCAPMRATCARSAFLTGRSISPMPSRVTPLRAAV